MFAILCYDVEHIKLLIVDRDYNDFLEDLEEDPSYRQNVNIYKGQSFACVFTCVFLNIYCKYKVVFFYFIAYNQKFHII